MLLGGSVGFGLVWGWLFVLLAARPPLKRPWLNAAATLFFTGWAAWLLFDFAGLAALILFLAAAALAFLLHFSWRVRLRREAAAPS